jgi:hypothetical protein
MIKNPIIKKRITKTNKSPYIFKINKLKNDNINKSSQYFKYNKEFSPLSGSEFDYEPELWNSDINIKDSHNCYSYAMGKIVKGLISKAQPGYASGFNHISNNDFSCSNLKKRIKKDSPGNYIEKFDNKCLPGFYKVFLALDIPNDYHWWRQDSNGYWSHKPGSTDVTNLDGNGKKIKNPLISSRDFKHRNYNTPCFFACIYSDLSRTLNRIYSS